MDRNERAADIVREVLPPQAVDAVLDGEAFGALAYNLHVVETETGEDPEVVLSVVVASLSEQDWEWALTQANDPAAWLTHQLKDSLGW